MLARGDGRKSVMPSLLEIVLRDRAGQPGLAERLQLQAEAFRECSCADAGRVKALDDLDGGIDKRGRAERRDIGAQIAVGIERMDDGEHGALQLRLQRQALRLKLQMGRQVLTVGDGVPVGQNPAACAPHPRPRRHARRRRDRPSRLTPGAAPHSSVGFSSRAVLI